ncbi:4Fe-4S binding protein [Bacillota bacterium LX-D]|nr:4Fe-4S binding protein [Bacillota bacterium LX-D]
MAYKITDSCIACGDCIAVCPKEAIDNGLTNFKQGWIYNSFNICKDCNECGKCLYVCPVNAISK